VCGGSNSTCTGCDGVPNSGKKIDRCCPLHLNRFSVLFLPSQLCVCSCGVCGGTCDDPFAISIVNAARDYQRSFLYVVCVCMCVCVCVCVCACVCVCVCVFCVCVRACSLTPSSCAAAAPSSCAGPPPQPTEQLQACSHGSSCQSPPSLPANFNSPPPCPPLASLASSRSSPPRSRYSQLPLTTKP